MLLSLKKRLRSLWNQSWSNRRWKWVLCLLHFLSSSFLKVSSVHTQSFSAKPSGPFFTKCSLTVCVCISEKILSTGNHSLFYKEYQLFTWWKLNSCFAVFQVSNIDEDLPKKLVLVEFRSLTVSASPKNKPKQTPGNVNAKNFKCFRKVRRQCTPDEP